MPCLFALLVATGSAVAQESHCQVAPFQGATSPQGAVARMRVANTGGACSITNYGVPSERRNAAESGRITRQPKHGKAEFVAPQVVYTPAPGYAGDDDFEYEALARGATQQSVQLMVRVEVLVVAP